MSLYRLPIFNVITYANLQIAHMKRKQELLKEYVKGWEDCANHKGFNQNKENLKDMQTAYRVGWQDAVVAPEKHKTENEILEEIEYFLALMEK